MLYVIDEPSIGLHQRDNIRLINSLKSLRDIGNTVIVVEHDRETMENADYIVDLGPGAGEHGGFVVKAGTFKEILSEKNSLTAAYFRDEKEIPVRNKNGSAQTKRIISKIERSFGKQSEKNRCELSTRTFHLYNRRQRLRKIELDERHPVQNPRETFLPFNGTASRITNQFPGIELNRQGGGCGSIAYRQDAAVESGNIRRSVHGDSRLVCPASRIKNSRI